MIGKIYLWIKEKFDSFRSDTVQIKMQTLGKGSFQLKILFLINMNPLLQLSLILPIVLEFMI